MLNEQIVRLGSLTEWRDLLRRHPELQDASYIEWLVHRARQAGAWSDHHGTFCPPGDVEVRGTNYREDLLVRGLNPRLRAVLDLLSQWPQAQDVYGLRVYAQEALTPFALSLRGRYARFHGTEYAADDAQRAAIFPIPAEDATRLSFADGSFDVALTNDVLEHIPDLALGIKELARVLRPGGLLLASFPFAFGHHETEIRAELKDGALVHHAEPEYHGNPLDPAGGSLVFQVPGWDILELCRAAGFAKAEMLFLSSPGRAYVSHGVAGVFVLRAIRAGAPDPQSLPLLPAPLAQAFRLPPPAPGIETEQRALIEDLRDFSGRLYGGLQARDAEITSLHAELGRTRNLASTLKGGCEERDAQILALNELATRLREEIGALKGGVAERDAAILELQGVATSLRERLGAAEGGVAERDAMILARNDELTRLREELGRLSEAARLLAETQGVLADREAEIQSLLARLAEAEAEITNLRVTVAGYLQSTSWKVTAPIRWVGGLKR
ncbi:MAG TPA: methyltransferase domain-containing protein [Azospirillaceae bacterium]|nr:methyltransferase domain-containing protein [Azospirillaceae bacterium]